MINPVGEIFANALCMDDDVLNEFTDSNDVAGLEQALLQSSVDGIINDPRFQKALRTLVADNRKELLDILEWFKEEECL